MADPITWSPGHLVLASDLNTELRDQLNAAIGVASTITTTGTQTALAIPSGRDRLVIHANNASLLTLQGITAGRDAQHLTIISRGAGQVDLVNESGSASGSNRITNHVTGTISLAPGSGRVVLVYDSTVARWRVTLHEQGAWITPTFAAGDYTASAGSWTVDSGDVTTRAYYLRGRTLMEAFWIVDTDVSAAPTQLRITIAGGFTASKTMIAGSGHLVNAGGTREALIATVGSGGTTINIEQMDVAAFTSTSSDNTSVSGTVLFEVQ